MRYVPSRVMRAKYVMYRVMRICCSVMGWLLSVGDEVVSGEGGKVRSIRLSFWGDANAKGDLCRGNASSVALARLMTLTAKNLLSYVIFLPVLTSFL